MPIVYFYYPETMGRSLEELEMMFAESDTVRDIVKESRRPLDGPLFPDNALEKGRKIDEDEYMH